jgi:hypothetical protein
LISTIFMTDALPIQCTTTIKYSFAEQQVKTPPT